MSEAKLSVGVVGATGYTGSELLRLLLDHDAVELSAVTSRSEAGVALSSYWPSLRGHCSLQFTAPDPAALADQCEVVFFATPHGVALDMVPELLDRGVRVIDLSADFRLRDAALWSKWYGQEHTATAALQQAVYGLPELNRESIANARLVACPGCYPTAVQLGFLPLLEQSLVDTSQLIANAASGVSGAGRQAKVNGLYAEVSESYKAYAVAGHRHLPEIRQTLDAVAGHAVNLTFVPHLLPMIRGICATLYCKPRDMGTDFQSVFEARYADEPFVDVLPPGGLPDTRNVRGTNICQIAVQPLPDSNTLVVLAVEDNLVKGAAGQAIQALNIMQGWDERRGLHAIALAP